MQHPEMEPFRTVDLTPRDAELIQQTAKVAYEASKSISKIWLPTVEAAIEEVHESLEREGISQVLLDGHRVAAWIGASPQFSGRVVEIHPLIVARGYHGKGLGRWMVNQVEAWARQQGALTLWIGTSDETHATSLSGVNLYENTGPVIASFHQVAPHPCGFWLRLGFHIVGVLPDAEGIGKPSIMMAKPLQQKGGEAHED
ncbi:GNAT family N-acetyltransferase [Nodosilinea sp. LEGE 07088]|uniref:GNAT family N-acetyltransferase n=1 Tax=Nodosilinea sp. LEGE 07088 TaxID=2777968 RepID=UPI00187FE57E|nr:GNAT family N-acetyltransferase [Nodosilinea sp. LEGE 07088]MBE9137019.1 GNAT family N-acetyltransferase [Nodosilinea sp. LEGE 07088]